MPLSCLKATGKGVSLFLQAVPRSSRTEIVDLSGDRCRIKVKAPPVDGEANLALIAFLAKGFRLPKAQVVLQNGATGKLKTFLLTGITLEQAELKLRELAGDLEPTKEHP